MLMLDLSPYQALGSSSRPIVIAIDVRYKCS